jgi:tetratricopeptide (TPR) repeat protein
VLRNLTIFSEKVAGFDEDAVRLESGKEVTWDEIQAGEVAPDKQEAFNALLEQLGEPMFRIRSRLGSGDYEGALSYAEQLYPIYAARNSASAYMVCQALMWARMQAGRREEAIEPYLKCVEYLRKHDGKDPGLPGSRRLKVDLNTGLSPELTPVWFDAEAAKKSLAGVKDALKSMASPRPTGAYLLYATLAYAAGEPDEAKPFLSAIDESVPVVVQLRDVAVAQGEVLAGADASAQGIQSLERGFDALLPQIKPLARYWIGMSRLNAKDEAERRNGLLDLLHLPALYETEAPELAAAGLYHAMHELAAMDDNSGAIALRRELLTRYASTTHAGKVKAASAVSGRVGTESQPTGSK